MALTYTEQYGSAAELTGFVRADAQVRPETFSLAAFLPDREIDDIDFRAGVGGTALKQAAVYRTYDAESPIVGTNHQQVITGQLPPISLKTRVSEYDRIKFNGRNGSGQLVTANEDNAVSLADQIRLRLEIARGQALMDGKVTLAENGLALNADFGRKVEHTQTAANLWGAAGATPLADLLSWRDIYSDTTGTDPAALVVSRKVMTALLNAEDTRTQVFGNDSGTRMVTQDNLNALLASHGLPQITVYGAKYEGADGKVHEVLDSNKILFVGGATQAVGETLWGVTAEALEPKFAIDQALQPGIVASSWVDDDPVALWTKASAVALPIVQNPNATFSATVLAA